MQFGLRTARWLALTLLAGAVPVAAQQDVVAGKVVVAGSETPLASAQVGVQGTRLSATTDEAGRFRITGVSGPVVLQVRRLGYRPVSQTTTAGSVGLVIAMVSAPIELEGVVVTGTPGEVQKRSIGNSVSQIDAVVANEFAVPGNVDKLIGARAAGVNVNFNSGRVGAGAEVNIRGHSSLSLADQPLIYIDGARVANDLASGPGVQGGGAISRLNDISPEDIESIEIIKGPAAATLYGTEASNGVIQIITKKGRAGRPVWNLSVQQGANWIMNPSERFGNSYGPSTLAAPFNYVSMNLVDTATAQGNPLFTTGHLQRYGLSLSGGSDRYQYFMSSNMDRDRGADPLNALNRVTVHANIKAAPNDKIDVTANLNYISSQTDLSSEFGISPMFSTLYGGPLIKLALNPTAGGYFFAPPSAFYQTQPFENTQDVSKFTGSVLLQHRPTTWLNHRITIGIDQTGEHNTALAKYLGPDLTKYFGEGKGGVTVDERSIRYTSIDYGVSATANLAKSLTAGTSAGVQYYRRQVNTILALGSDFPGPGLRTVRATVRNRINSQDELTNTTIGAYIEEKFSWNNRAFIAGAVRVDNNSAFGSNFDLVAYPKVSGSWVLSEEPFWHIGFLKTLRLRAAYGQSGLQPSALVALRTYTPTTGPGEAPAVIPTNVGNLDLKPERGTEFEAGFEANLFDRIGVEFTYFNRRTKDALLLRGISPSTGFTGTQWVNIGETKNQGMELAVNVGLAASKNVVWDIGGTIATSKDEVVSMGDLGQLQLSSSGQFYREGYPLGGYWVKRVVSATLVDNPTPSASGAPLVATNVMCDGGPGAAPMACGAAPRVFIGTPTPKAIGAITTTVTLFGRLQLYGMVDYKVGHHLFNFDSNVRCSVLPTCEVDYYPEKYDPAYVAEVQLGGSQEIASRYVEKASFARLREVSVSYSLPNSWLKLFGASRAVLSVAGRNLHTWTGYTGLDPETHIAVGSGNASTLRLPQAQQPLPAQLVTSLRVTF